MNREEIAKKICKLENSCTINGIELDCSECNIDLSAAKIEVPLPYETLIDFIETAIKQAEARGRLGAAKKIKEANETNIDICDEILDKNDFNCPFIFEKYKDCWNCISDKIIQQAEKELED